MTELPRDAFGIKTLCILEATHNEITNIPSDIAQLTRLTCLRLENNHIAEVIYKMMLEISPIAHIALQIPKALLTVSTLTELRLSANFIEKIPTKVSNQNTIPSSIFSFLKKRRIRSCFTDISSFKFGVFVFAR